MSKCLWKASRRGNQHVCLWLLKINEVMTARKQTAEHSLSHTNELFFTIFYFLNEILQRVDIRINIVEVTFVYKYLNKLLIRSERP